MEIVVHRGANKIAPENTKASAEACIALAVDFVEIDVRLSKDRIPFILHDSSVDRTSNGSGQINDLTSDQIEKLDAGSWFHAKFAGEKIPRLEDFLCWINGKCKVFMDMKDPLFEAEDLKKIFDLIYELKMENECFFGFQDESEDSQIAREFSEIAPQLLFKINANSLQEIKKAKSHYKAAIVETSLNHFTDEYKAICQDLQLKTMIWEPFWTIAMFQRVLQSGADMIDLDDPHLFLQIKEQKGNWQDEEKPISWKNPMYAIT